MARKVLGRNCLTEKFLNKINTRSRRTSTLGNANQDERSGLSDVMNGKLNHYNVPSIASATRSRRNISILCCLSAPVHKSLIYHIGEKKKKKNLVKSDQFFSGEQYFSPSNNFTRIELTPSKNFIG